MLALWINVDECIRRKHFMADQFKNIKFITKNKRISAITPDNIDEYVDDRDLPYKCDPSNNHFKDCKNCKIEYCTLISHMLAIEEGYKSNEDWFIIFEDDTVIAHEINMENLLKTIPDDAEVLQLHCCMGPTVEQLYSIYKQGAKWIQWKMIIPSASGYIVSRKAAEKMLKLYKKTGTSGTSNRFCFKDSKSCRLADVMTYETCKTYVHTYPAFYSNVDYGSLIHPDHLPSHEYANNIIKKIINTDNTPHIFLTKLNI
jgi:GR25 family glycosyltransferase involved in LPS biosynthesis